MRRAPAGQVLSAGYQNGTVLQVFNGTHTASPVSFGNTITPTGFPANSPFVKLRSESFLSFVIELDYNPGGGADTIWAYLYVDNVLIEGVAHQVTTSDESSVAWVMDGDKFNGDKWAAGSHTVEIRALSTQNHSCSILTDSACQIQIIEYL